jgi:hypothetical protein
VGSGADESRLKCGHCHLGQRGTGEEPGLCSEQEPSWVALLCPVAAHVQLLKKALCCVDSHVARGNRYGDSDREAPGVAWETVGGSLEWPAVMEVALIGSWICLKEKLSQADGVGGQKRMISRGEYDQSSSPTCVEMSQCNPSLRTTNMH